MKAGKLVSGLALIVLVAACTTAVNRDLSGMSFASDPLIGKVIWHDLISEDLEAAKTFYGGLFGWTFEEATARGGYNYVVAKSGDVYVAGLLEFDSPNDGNSYSRWLPYVSVDDVDEAVMRATSAGGSVAAPAREVSIGRVAAIVDPQGAVMGLIRSDIGDPDDKTTAPGPGRPVWSELLASNSGDAAAFYSALAGYDVKTGVYRERDYAVLQSGGATRAGIVERPSENVKTDWLTFYGVNDPVAAAERAAALGGEILLPASKNLRNGTVSVVTDPSGAILVLQKWTASEGGRS